MSSTLKIQKLSPSIGAELSGVDLSQTLSQDTAAAIRQALLDHKVIFFRGQDLEPLKHMEFARIFGELEAPHPIFPNIEGAEQVSVLEHDEARPGQENEYHTDVTWRAEPAMGSVLHALEVPDVGGDTIFVNLAAVFAALALPVQEMLIKLEAWHSIEVFANSTNFDNAKDANKFADILKSFPPQKHPLVRTHPETGENGIYINRIFTTRIEGLSRWESENIKRMIFEVAERPEYQVRFKWTKGSVAVWDNRCTHHYAIADYHGAYRKMHRVTIKGDKPFYQASGMSAAAE